MCVARGEVRPLTARVTIRSMALMGVPVSALTFAQIWDPGRAPSRAKDQHILRRACLPGQASSDDQPEV